MKVCQVALSELESMLGGLNYVPSFQLTWAPLIPGCKPEEYISAALSPGAVIGAVTKAEGPEVLAEVEGCLRYVGDHGHGPPPEALQSPRFEELVARVMAYLADAVEKAAAVRAFWLSAGHPFYPVFWDFAYLLVGPDGAVVFIGSSSD